MSGVTLFAGSPVTWPLPAKMWLPRGVSEANGRTTGSSTAILYWRPGCPFCMRLRLALWVRRLEVEQVNIWKDKEAAAFVRSVAGGNETVPTVVIGGETTVNPTPGRVASAIRAA